MRSGVSGGSSASATPFGVAVARSVAAFPFASTPFRAAPYERGRSSTAHPGPYGPVPAVAKVRVPIWAVARGIDVNRKRTYKDVLSAASRSSAVSPVKSGHLA